MATGSTSLSVSRELTPRPDHSRPPSPTQQTAPSNDSTHNGPDKSTNAENPVDKGPFEPEKHDHLEHPNGAYYAGSRKDFPLPASRHPLPPNSVQRLVEPEPGTNGGRQRHYLDDPNSSIHGFWTESGNWEDWPPKSPLPNEGEEQGEEASVQDGSQTRRSSDSHNNAAGGARRQTNGTIGSVYSGNKLRHLKKDDGIPLWRKDIQYEFLRLIFEDTTPVFTRASDGEKGKTFADVYIDTMAKSSKTSKILKDKLQSDKPAAVNMAMVCLLVNFGRMNTTLNCSSSTLFPPSILQTLNLCNNTNF